MAVQSTEWLAKLFANKRRTLFVLSLVTILTLISIHAFYPRRTIDIAAIMNSDFQAEQTDFTPLNTKLVGSIVMGKGSFDKTAAKEVPNEQLEQQQKVLESEYVTNNPPSKAETAKTKTKMTTQKPPDQDIANSNNLKQNKQPEMYLPEKSKTKTVNGGGNNEAQVSPGQRNLPSVIVIGTPVCGVLPFYAFMSVHPQIVLTKDEVQYFNNEDNYIKGINWYKEQMPYAKDGQITMEKGQHYFASEKAPERIQKLNKDVKLIYIICDATFRAFAHYIEMLKLDITWKITDGNMANKTHPAVVYSMYSEHLERWQKFFPAENIFVLESDMMLRNPIEELGKIEEYLGIETKINPQNVYFNSSAFTYCIKTKENRHCLEPNAIAKAPNEFPHETVFKVRAYLRTFSDKLFELINHKYNWL